jgi:acyl dehydratase
MASPPRAFEDFAVGLRFESARAIAVTAERIKSFAAEFDPQSFHLDEDAGLQGPLGGFAASGWHTAAIAMRLVVDSDLGLAGQGAGVAVETMRWRAPVRAGDSLRLQGRVTETRPSRSRPDHGIVKFQITVFNQRQEAVLEAGHVVLVARRDAIG